MNSSATVHVEVEQRYSTEAEAVGKDTSRVDQNMRTHSDSDVAAKKLSFAEPQQEQSGLSEAERRAAEDVEAQTSSTEDNDIVRQI